MIRSLLLNFCILVTLTYLLSLTYRTWPEPRGQWRQWRLIYEALMPLALLLYPTVIVPGVFVDLRVVPLALTTLRYGPAAGLLVALPVMLYRLYLGGVGVNSSLLSALGVILMVSLVRQRIPHEALQFYWRSPWLALLVMFFPNALLLPLVAHDLSLYLTVYLPLLLLDGLAFLIAYSMLSSRLRLLQLTATLQVQAHQDPLTGLLNRRQLDDDLSRVRAGDALLLVDIDFFKRINDLYGHQAGDSVLTRVGRELGNELRSRDRVYRYGGEEFAIILKCDESSDPRSVAERLRLRLASLKLPELMLGHITVSIGVAVSTGTQPPDTLLRQADDALYQAKEGGRNRVQLWQSVIQQTAEAS